MESLEESLANGHPSQLIIGRLKYDHDSKNIIEQEFDAEQIKGLVVGANLVPSIKFLELFIQCMKKTSWF